MLTIRPRLLTLRALLPVLVLGGMAMPGLTTTVGADSVAGQLANQIESRVRKTVKTSPAPVPEANVTRFEQLAVAESWSEIWPDSQGGEVTRKVKARVWNAAIQAALDEHGTVFIPRRDEPYYINNPIVLKSGQWLSADREAEIRLVPGTNTCMVRNEHLISGHEGPIPADAKPDTQIVIEGGIWTTLATSQSQSNGNTQGWPARQERAIPCHGVILFNNVRGVAVRNLTIRQSRAHAVQLSSCSEFLVEGVTFDTHRRDGVHVNGPANYGVIRNIRGVTYDDFIALNAWDWKHTVPCFGSIDHVLVENIHCDPQLSGHDEIRLLPGTKIFADGRKLDCPVADCVFRNLQDVRTFKIYDQPNGELGRDNDFSDPIGTLRNVHFENLIYNRPGRFEIAVNVERLTVDNVQVNFDLGTPEHKSFKLVEIGPRSQTYRINPNDPSTWTELFSPDKDLTVQGFRLGDVRVKAGSDTQPLPNAEASLVRVVNQTLNPNYPKTTPRGGTGKVTIIP